MKIERSTKEYGGGSGSAIFESDFFRVVWWIMSRGQMTVIEIKLDSHTSIYMEFDGHYEFDSDEKCFEQMNFEEFKEFSKIQNKHHFRKGEISRSKEFKKLLND